MINKLKYLPYEERVYNPRKRRYCKDLENCVVQKAEKQFFSDFRETTFKITLGNGFAVISGEMRCSTY